MTSDLQNTFYALEHHFSRGISLKIHVFDEAVAYIDGVDEAKFNLFLQRKAHHQPEHLINEAKQFFAMNNILSWIYVVPSYLDTLDLRHAFQAHNLIFDEDSTAMYCALGTPAQNSIEPETPLIIQSADVNKKAWLQILQGSFGGTDATNAQCAQALDRAKGRVDMQHYLGTLDDEPIAAITLTFLNDSVRIDNVATAPTHQRLGYGSQMVQFGVNLSHAKGFNHCFLDASSNGLSVYQRLGFCEIFTYHIYAYEGEVLTKT